MRTRIGFLPVIAVSLAAAAPAPPPAKDGIVRREAVSSAETWKESGGRRITHTVNRRFTFAAVYPERYKKVELLLSETFDRRMDSGAEGEKSRVMVEGSAAGDPSGKPLWKIETDGSSGEATDQNVYRVNRPGCCGAQDLGIYFSLVNGKELILSDAPILTMEVPNSSLRRFVGYQDTMAASPIPGEKTRKGVVGMLQYGSDREPAERLFVVADNPEPPEDFAAKKLSIVVNGKEAEDSRFDVWAADKSSDPSKIGGFSVRVRDFSNRDLLFEIPVEADRLVPEKAKVAKGVHLEK